MIADPPSSGADHDTVAAASPATADTDPGAAGTVAGGTVAAGVTASDGDDDTEVPTALVAVTVNVYAVPLVSPVTVHEAAPEVEHVLAPGDEVTV